MGEDMKKPHICFVSESEATYGLLTGKAVKKAGGAELQQYIIAMELRKLGYPVSFVVQDFGQPYKLVTQDGIALIKTSRHHKGVRILRYFNWLRCLFKAMKDADADIYYERCPGMVTGITALSCKLNRKTFVYSVAHNHDLDGSWKGELSGRDYFMFKYGLSRAEKIIVQSNDQMQMLTSNSKGKGVIIRSAFIAPSNQETRGDRDSVLWVANFRKMKRPEMYINLANSLPQYKFVMVGGSSPGEENLYEELSARAREVPNLEATGAVPHVEVGKHFDRALLFVNTTSTEGFPNTFLQAWCRGIPVVTTFDPDSIVEKYGLGRYCSSPDDLAKAVDELAQDETMRKRLGERAVKYVHEHHSPESVGSEYDKLFMRVWRSR